MSFWRESVRCDLDIRPAAVSFQLCWAPLLLVTNLAGRSSILRCCAKAASCQRGCWPRARSRFRWRTARPCAGASARRRRSSGRGRPTSRRRTIPGGDRSSPPPRARRPEDEAARAGRRAVDLWTSPADRRAPFGACGQPVDDAISLIPAREVAPDMSQPRQYRARLMVLQPISTRPW